MESIKDQGSFACMADDSFFIQKENSTMWNFVHIAEQTNEKPKIVHNFVLNSFVYHLHFSEVLL